MDKKKAKVWLENQKNLYHQGKLSDDQIRKLTEAGFDFTRKKDKDEERWLLMLEKAKSQGYVSSRDNVGAWISVQRRYSKNGKIRPDRLKLLKENNFPFDADKFRWESAFNKVKEEGVKSKMVWLRNQRQRFLDGNLEDWKAPLLKEVWSDFDKEKHEAMTVESFIEKANIIHGDYDYSKTIYSGYENHLIITCKEHGDYKITPREHLRIRDGVPMGKCPKCKN